MSSRQTTSLRFGVQTLEYSDMRKRRRRKVDPQGPAMI